MIWNVKNSKLGVTIAKGNIADFVRATASVNNLTLPVLTKILREIADLVEEK